MTTVPLSVLDLSPFGSGQTPADGLRATIALAQSAERLGYSRYWLAEHHLNPGVAGAAPHVLLASIADKTSRIRIGTAATIIGNYSPLQVVEAAGVVSALHPGRFDLGIGRSGSTSSAQTPPRGGHREDRVVDGILLPAPHAFSIDAARFVAQARLLGRTPGDADRFEQDVLDILALIDGTYVAPEGVPIHATPSEGQDIQVWLHGSTAGPSAELAGRLGLPFGANYHVAPTFVLEAVEAYRRAFRPGVLAEPRVIVSVDVLAADSNSEALRLAAGYPHWVHSIRAGDGAIPYPSPTQALTAPLDSASLAVVRDRVATQFAGSAAAVAERLDGLRRVTGADELLVTTVTHDPADREHSYELLAQAWGLQAPSFENDEATDASADASSDGSSDARSGQSTDAAAARAADSVLA
ncbi:LLM class flavin-dependent oxidoreductase [Microbacterium sp. 4R-513]|uniref:LLM class flavin-dependent oxidoreductase n=1 Tax=Microbacterium sp. 4R-513 TaxID=2567934 RepID=UPI0013E1F327|nr:LLM class flavin-dependent oxidoreductase [Microbacterium sp. 4R-513]QIG39570.1 LLM class flavin-dependent oxidoreductase [Microbacterium sp. 4R-513]